MTPGAYMQLSRDKISRVCYIPAISDAEAVALAVSFRQQAKDTAIQRRRERPGCTDKALHDCSRRACRGCCFVVEGREGIWKLRGNGRDAPYVFKRADGRWNGKEPHYFELNPAELDALVRKQKQVLRLPDTVLDGGEVDMHVKTAARVFGVKPEQVTPMQRSLGKMVNFVTAYT